MKKTFYMVLTAIAIIAVYAFSNAEVGKFYNQNFINVAFDGEKGYGIMLMQKYNLRSYPSLLFIDENGKVIKKTAGYHNSSQLLSLADKYSLKN